MSKRLATAIVLFAIFSGTFASNALGPIYVIYEQRFDLTPLTITAVFATYAISVLAALICVGRLSDDIGRRPMLLAGALLLIASTLILLTDAGTLSLFGGRLVQGLANGTIASAGAAAVVDLRPDHDRVRSSILTTTVFLFGAACGPLVFGVVAQLLPHPLTTPYLFDLAIELLVLVGVIAIGEPSVPPGRVTQWRIQRPSVPRAIRRPFAIASVVITAGWMVGAIVNSLSGSMDRQLLHIDSHTLAGVMLFVYSAIGGASQLIARHLSPRRTMLGGMGATALGMIAIEMGLLAASAAPFIVGTALTGIGAGLAFSGSLGLMNRCAPHHMRAEILTAYNVVGYFSLSLPVVGVGLLANAIGLQHASVVFAVFPITLAVVAAAMLKSASTDTGETIERSALASMLR